jgi:hypothetical protein
LVESLQLSVGGGDRQVDFSKVFKLSAQVIYIHIHIHIMITYRFLNAGFCPLLIGDSLDKGRGEMRR